MVSYTEQIENIDKKIRREEAKKEIHLDIARQKKELKRKKKELLLLKHRKVIGVAGKISSVGKSIGKGIGKGLKKIEVKKQITKGKKGKSPFEAYREQLQKAFGS